MSQEPYPVGERLDDNGKYCSCDLDVSGPDLVAINQEATYNFTFTTCDPCLELGHSDFTITTEAGNGLTITGGQGTATVQVEAGSSAANAWVYGGARCVGCDPEVGYCAQTSMEVEVVNVSVAVSASRSPSRVNEEVTFTFTVAGNTIPPHWQDATWEFGDGGTGTGNDVQHTFISTGTYGVTVTVICCTSKGMVTVRGTYQHQVGEPGLTMTPYQLTLDIGESATLSVTLTYPRSGDTVSISKQTTFMNGDVTLSSTQLNLSSGSASFTVTGTRMGKVTVTVQYSGAGWDLSDDTVVTVRPVVTITPQAATVVPGIGQTMQVTTNSTMDSVPIVVNTSDATKVDFSAPDTPSTGSFFFDLPPGNTAQFPAIGQLVLGSATITASVPLAQLDVADATATVTNECPTINIVPASTGVTPGTSSPMQVTTDSGWPLLVSLDSSDEDKVDTNLGLVEGVKASSPGDFQVIGQDELGSVTITASSTYVSSWNVAPATATVYNTLGFHLEAHKDALTGVEAVYPTYVAQEQNVSSGPPPGAISAGVGQDATFTVLFDGGNPPEGEYFTWSTNDTSPRNQVPSGQEHAHTIALTDLESPLDEGIHPFVVKGTVGTDEEFIYCQVYSGSDAVAYGNCTIVDANLEPLIMLSPLAPVVAFINAIPGASVSLDASLGDSNFWVRTEMDYTYPAGDDWSADLVGRIGSLSNLMDEVFGTTNVTLNVTGMTLEQSLIGRYTFLKLASEGLAGTALTNPTFLWNAISPNWDSFKDEMVAELQNSGATASASYTISLASIDLADQGLYIGNTDTYSDELSGFDAELTITFTATFDYNLIGPDIVQSLIEYLLGGGQ